MGSRGFIGVPAAAAVSYVLVVPYVTAADVVAGLGLSLWAFVGAVIAGYLGGAVAAVLARRVPAGRLLVGGLLVTGVVALGLPHVPGAVYLALLGALNVVGGALFVVTPVLVVEASPARARATALGCWALGPALGGLAAVAAADRVPTWQTQTTLSGCLALATAALSLLLLRGEARRPGAADTGAGSTGARVGVAAVVLGACLVVHTLVAGLFVLYAAVRLGYPAPRIRGVLTFYWVAHGLAVVVGGVTSDAFGARKPFLAGGAALGAGGVVLLALHPDPSRPALAGIVVTIAAGAGVVCSAGLAALTESTTPTRALAVWGAAQRVTAALALAALVVLVPSAAPQADDEPKLQALRTRYPTELATATRLDPEIVVALAENPDDQSTRILAVAQLTGLPAAVVGPVLFTQREYPDEIETYWASIPRGPGRYWLSGPDDPNPWATWVHWIAGMLKVDPATAVLRLRALDRATDADFPKALRYGAQIGAATARLDAITRLPAADLRYLRERGPAVLEARAAAPHEWRRWWWVLAAAQLALVPLVWVFGEEAGRE